MEIKSRLRELKTEKYDLIVIGGGIVGAGVARDAVLRGLSTVLFEQGDFASGTSSRTSRMIHGGIRYLEQGEFRLVFEASRERAILHRLAPHLVRPLSFLFPIYKETGRPPWMIRAGMILYDLMALFRNFHPHRMLSAKEILQQEPGLSPIGLRGGALFYDAQMDDARLCLEVLLSARSSGAVIFNYTPVEGFIRRDGQIMGVLVRDLLTGERREVLGEQVINATGPWLDKLASMADPIVQPRLRTTRGSHLLVPRITREHAVVVTSRGDDRVFFVIPWKGETLIGTTDLDYKEDPAQVRATPEEVAYLVNETRRVFPNSGLTEGQVIARFAGVRPLVNEPAVGASEVSREMEVSENRGGMISIVGGKYTLHRLTAQQVVDRVVRKWGIRTEPSKSDRTPLWGGRMASLESYLQTEVPRAAQEYDVSQEEVRRLIRIYGARYERVLDRINKDRLLLSRVVPGELDILAQIDHAVQEEMAVRLSDFLRRRTGLALGRHRHDLGMLKTVSERMGMHLGWDAKRQHEEIQSYLVELE
ncbi:MAG: glycerol-3-phosphate dehydrogenase [Nitrospira sp.]|nr:glycerol-3-phosphate dehydrogenase [Nitrospira sp.]